MECFGVGVGVGGRTDIEAREQFSQKKITLSYSKKKFLKEFNTKFKLSMHVPVAKAIFYRGSPKQIYQPRRISKQKSDK